MTTEKSVGCLCFANRAPGLSNGIIKYRYSDFHVHEIDRDGKVVYLESLEPLSLPDYPPGYLEWLDSSQIFFSFQPESELQKARIWYEQPDLVWSYNQGTATLERTRKKRVRPPITGFVLYKENTTQQDAIGRIAKRTGKKKNQIGFAGQKDKRGITTQICTMKDISIDRLMEVNDKLGPGVLIGMYRQSLNPISLGDLSGNRFTIVLRNIGEEADMETGIAARMEALSASGFLNYYGMQRFGTGKVPTHEIGKMVLRREWKRIIETLLRPDDDELERIHQAKQHYHKTKDCRGALKILPSSAQDLYAIFEAMSRIPNPDDHLKNPHELFSRIDRRQRMMYVHAYQSYLWNNMVSMRWQQSGNNVVVGDFVMDKQTGEVVPVTIGNIQEYSIFDVVIPLPSGSSTINKTLLDIMNRDGVTPEMFDNLSREYGAGGDWRHMMASAKDLEWRIIRHDDMDADLIDSDLDRLNGTTNEGNHVENGRFVSLVLSFSLGSGQYATMCLRELLKRSTEWFTDSAMSTKSKKGLLERAWDSIPSCNVQ